MTERKVKRMWALPGALFTLERAALMVGADRSLVTVPAPCFLIEHRKGLVLFDAGTDPKVADFVAMNVDEKQFGNIRVDYDSERTVENQLKSLGFRVKDIRCVIVSHLHMDHTGSLPLFSEVPLIAGANELRYGYWPVPSQRMSTFKFDDYLPTRNFNWIELDRDFDLFGDGSIEIVQMPGHTPGNLAAVIQLPNREVVLGGDTVHFREAIDLGATMPADVDMNLAVQSISRLKAYRDFHEALIWNSHDPDDWKENPHAPDFLD